MEMSTILRCWWEYTKNELTKSYLCSSTVHKHLNPNTHSLSSFLNPTPPIYFFPLPFSLLFRDFLLPISYLLNICKCIQRTELISSKHKIQIYFFSQLKFIVSAYYVLVLARFRSSKIMTLFQLSF